MRSRSFLLLLSLGLLLAGCPNYKYPTGHFPEDVMNFGALNTEFDDFNPATPPVIDHDFMLYFSSNRNSEGGNFDFVEEEINIRWDTRTGKLTIDLNTGGLYGLAPAMMDSITSGCNELGPHFIADLDSRPGVISTRVMMYSNDCSGDHDIVSVVWETVHGMTIGTEVPKITGPATVAFLNSGYNDMYPHYDAPSYANDYQTQFIYYCSDRDGDFDIFLVSFPVDSMLLDMLQHDFPVTSQKLPVNSEQDDKCPFTLENMLFFASDRAGGYGGFDLYYSTLVNGTWTEPKNLGDRINTSSNEYRPIVSEHYAFSNMLLIFSSDRPGGKGGYDLYYTGITRNLQ